MVGRMYQVDVYLRVRKAVMVEGMSIREASRCSACTGTRCARCWPTRCRWPKLEPFTATIDRILEDDLRLPRKQRHTAQRIFQQLRDDHGFGGQYTIIKDYVRERRRASPRRCSCRCPTLRATPSATLARPW